MSDMKNPIVVTHPSVSSSDHAPASESANKNGAGLQDATPEQTDSSSEEVPADQLDKQKKGWLAYFKTKEFYIILVLGYVFPNRTDTLHTSLCDRYLTRL